MRPVLSGQQRALLTDLQHQQSEPVTEAWLIDRPYGQYALVVQTVIGNYVRKWVVAPSTLTKLHAAGLIEYGETRTDMEYLDKDPGDLPPAMRVWITPRGTRTLSNQQARHRA